MTSSRPGMPPCSQAPTRARDRCAGGATTTRRHSAGGACRCAADGAAADRAARWRPPRRQLCGHGAEHRWSGALWSIADEHQQRQLKHS